jgi:4a-hydroxytetrahydrobiopterin dehydratase
VATLLNQQEIDEALQQLGGWSQVGKSIIRELELTSFLDALAFSNAVGELAEAADHHPDILIHGWNRVRLTLSTHSAGGLTENDMKLAASINGLEK